MILIDEFMHCDDSVYKRKNSMKLKVYRYSPYFDFVLDKVIGKK
jgi:hypothetical protein